MPHDPAPSAGTPAGGGADAPGGGTVEEPHRSQRRSQRRSLAAALALGALVATAQPAGAAVEPRVDAAVAQRSLGEAIAVVDTYWADNYSSTFGGRYVSPQIYTGVQGVQGMYSAKFDAMNCGGEDALVALNAVYCTAPVGRDWLTVSDDLLYAGTEQLSENFAYLVVAHEWGHAIQTRQPAQATAWPELQADCLAGATLAGAAAQGLITWNERQSEQMALGLAALGNRTAWTDPTSHGSSSERVFFFEHGVANGVEGCLRGASPAPDRWASRGSVPTAPDPSVSKSGLAPVGPGAAPTAASPAASASASLGAPQHRHPCGRVDDRDR